MADRVSNGAGGQSHFLFTKFFVPVVILLVAVPAASGWYIWKMCQQFNIVESQQIKMFRLSGRLSHLDEILTMSSRMAVATGDLEWERRYRKFEPQLDAAIKEITTLAPEASMSKAAAQTSAANARLVEMENKAFELLREGNRQAAMTMLHGVEYAEQKRIYSDGIKDFTEALQGYTHAQLNRHRREILIAALFVAGSAFLVLLIWVGMLARLKFDTERRRAEKSLRKSEAQFKIIYEDTPVGLYRTTPDGRILMANPALVRMLGYSSFEELAQRNLEKEGYEPQYSRSKFKERIEKEGRVVGLESMWLKRDGTSLFIMENSRAIRDSDGNTLYYEGTAEDITDRKKAEKEVKKFRTIAERAGYGNAISDVKGNLLYVNESFARMHGYRIAELQGKNLSLFHSEEQMERVNRLNERLLQEGNYTGEEVWHKKRDNTVFPTLMNGTLVRDDKGSPSFMAATVIDITERKRAEVALRESEEKYRVLVEAADEAIATIDRNGVLLFVNGVEAERLGGKPDDYIGKTMWDVFPQEFADRRMMIIRNVIDSGQGTKMLALTNFKDRARWYDSTLEPLRNEKGEIAAVLVIARDVHEAKQAQEQLDTYREEVARTERLASLGTLSATITHELSQPLTTVGLSIENSLAELKAASGSKALVEKLEEALAGLADVNTIVNRFRGFAKVSADKTAEQVNLEMVAQRIVNLLSQSALKTKVALKIEDMEELPSICSSKRDIEQLFFALTENAIQAADGKKNRRLTISGAEKNEYVELRFSDTCGGIATDNIERIFEPFFTTGSAGERTGLGLCIVKRIVTGAGGTVNVESKVGKGSTFCVTLPIREDNET